MWADVGKHSSAAQSGEKQEEPVWSEGCGWSGDRHSYGAMEWKRVSRGGMEVEIAKADDSLPSFECDCEEKARLFIFEVFLSCCWVMGWDWLVTWLYGLPRIANICLTRGKCVCLHTRNLECCAGFVALLFGKWLALYWIWIFGYPGRIFFWDVQLFGTLWSYLLNMSCLHNSKLSLLWNVSIFLH